FRWSAGEAGAHAEQDRGHAAGTGPAYRRSAQGIRLCRQRNRRVACGQGDLTRSFRGGAKRRTLNPDAGSEFGSGFRVRSLRSRPGMTALIDRGKKRMSQTDKMLSRKEGKVGYLTFNNPERHN